MSIKKAALLAGMSMLAAHAYGQGSVTLYGLINLGVGYVSNAGGKSLWAMQNGTVQNSRWGLRGLEDLGGGSSAIFTLENGFDPTNGGFNQNGRLFGRQAFVGLANDRYGTVTFGRQYDALIDVLSPFSAPFVSSDLSFNIGDNDDTAGSFRYSNSAKYVSPLLAGFRFEGLYAFSNTAGDFSYNRASSFGLSYSNGSISAGLAYTVLDRPGPANLNGAVSNDYAGAPFLLFRQSPLNPAVGVKRQSVFGGGGAYHFGAVVLSGLITDVRYQYLDGTSIHLMNYQLSSSYFVTPYLILAGGYTYTGGRYGGLAGAPHWNTVHASVDYLLSKRTDVALEVLYDKSTGGPADIVPQTPSTSGNQTVAIVSIRHKF